MASITVTVLVDKISGMMMTLDESKLTTQFGQSLWCIGELLKCSSILETQKRVQFIICTNQLAVGYSGNIVCISVYCVNF
jgi:hypothetical protein